MKDYPTVPPGHKDAPTEEQWGLPGEPTVDGVEPVSQDPLLHEDVWAEEGEQS
jgi:hypothetical protein